jgi:hypothetical protein
MYYLYTSLGAPAQAAKSGALMMLVDHDTSPGHPGAALHRRLPALMFIAAGTLNDSGWVVPTSHIWIEKVSPGVTLQDDALKVEGQPEDRQLLMDAFSRICGGNRGAQ